MLKRTVEIPDLSGKGAIDIETFETDIRADHDTSGTGGRAAHEAARWWLAEGRRVRVAMPPETLATLLTGHGAAKINEAHNVAT
jgi:hypothetical protein